MSFNLRGVPNVYYIAGRTFTSEYGVHEAGELVEEAPTFQNLEVMISSGFIYPYCPDSEYDYLPPHIFNHIHTREQVMAIIAGDPTPWSPPQYQAGKPEAVELAEAEAADQRTPVDYARENSLKLQLARQEKQKETDKQPVGDVVTKREAAKKTPTKRVVAKKGSE